jgi:Protein of unknown function (DUF3800)
MRAIREIPHWYFVDEAGDPAFYGAGKRIIVGEEGCSRTFSVGFLRTGDPQHIRAKLAEVRLEISESKYLKSIPSVQGSLLAFHAKDDCQEVRHLVYEALLKTDFRAQVVVARKKESTFVHQFKGSQDRFYDFLVTRLFQNRLHLYKPTTIVFSRRGNRERQRALRDAIDLAIKTFREKYHHDCEVEIGVETNQPVQEPVLQAIDYVLWAVQRAFEKGQMRYFDFLRDKVEFLWDIFDYEKRAAKIRGQKNIYVLDKNPFEITKASPLS